MKTKLWFTVVLLVACMATLPVSAQNFPTTPGNDTVASFGKFWILIDPPFQPLFTGCPGYDPATHVLQSPTLYDNNTTVIGRSKSIVENSHDDTAGVPVGSAGTTVGDGNLTEPSGFHVAANSNEVHTELHYLNMITYGAGPIARVRAGVCYHHAASTTCPASSPPFPISPGEVVSNNATPGSHPDFPARSYFNVFAQIDIPACPLPAHFPATTVANKKPLMVETASIGGFPPSGVLYSHDPSSAVAVKFVAAGQVGNTKWKKNERLGCVILAGHGIIPQFPIRKIGEVQDAPSVVPVALQKERPEQAERMRPPNKEEVAQEARKFDEHMKGEHEKQGGRHKDCGPRDKDDEGDGDDHGGGKDHDKDHGGKDH